MEVVINRQGYKLTIAAWQLAAERLDVGLSEMGEVKQNELMWAIILSAAKLYNFEHQKRWTKRKEKRLLKRLKVEHIKYELGDNDNSTLNVLTKKIQEAFSNEQARSGEGSKKK